MIKPSYKDIAVIIILTILSFVCLTLPSLNKPPVNVLPILLILFFLPGYSILAAVDPLLNRSGILKRVFLSIVISLVITMFLSILSTYTLIKLSNYLILTFLVIFFCIIAIINRKRFSKRLGSYHEEKIKEPITETEESKEFEAISEDSRQTDDSTSHKEYVPTTEGEEPQIETDKPKITQSKIPTERKKEIKTPKPKRRFFSLDILLVIILTALCALFVLEPTLNKTVVRTALGLLLVLFLPGYALIAALFPKKDDLDSIERLALSFGLSIAITPLIGLLLNYTPYGIRLDPILISLTGVTVLLCALAFLRRRRIPKDDRFFVNFGGFFGGVRQGFSSESRTGKILSVVLILSIILAISTTAYIIIKPKEGESFTEFYILGPDGKASNYPTNLTSNQEGKLIIGIVNHENAKTSYRLVVTSNGTVQTEQTVTLQDGQKMEIPFNFTAGNPGERKMEFLLYKLPDNNNVYRSLHLWLNVTGS